MTNINQDLSDNIIRSLNNNFDKYVLKHDLSVPTLSLAYLLFSDSSSEFDKNTFKINIFNQSNCNNLSFFNALYAVLKKNIIPENSNYRHYNFNIELISPKNFSSNMIENKFSLFSIIIGLPRVNNKRSDPSLESDDVHAYRYNMNVLGKELIMEGLSYRREPIWLCANYNFERWKNWSNQNIGGTIHSSNLASIISSEFAKPIYFKK